MIDADLLATLPIITPEDMAAMVVGYRDWLKDEDEKAIRRHRQDVAQGTADGQVYAIKACKRGKGWMDELKRLSSVSLDDWDLAEPLADWVTEAAELDDVFINDPSDDYVRAFVDAACWMLEHVEAAANVAAMTPVETPRKRPSRAKTKG